MIEYRRHLSDMWALAASFIAALLPVSAIVYSMQLLPELGIVIYKEQFLAYLLTLAMTLVFILIPPFKHRNGLDKDKTVVVPWYDLLLIMLVLASGGYTTLWYHELLPQIGLLTIDKVIVSTVGIALLLEATRRCAGWTMVIVGVAALSYALLGHHLDGLFEVRRIRFDRLMLYNYMGQGAIHGIPLYVAATIVTIFMLFGQILFGVGGGKAVSDFAFAIMGRRRGGPAKVSVIASAIFGSMSGSASANVATTGMVTIPMMKQSGYPGYKAAAIEAVSSTGGLVLPPIMAATGFIIAEFLAIPYSEVAIAAVVPALLFYMCVYFQVDLEAAKHGITSMHAAEIPLLKPALKVVIPIILPFAVLIYALFVQFQSPENSAFYAILTTLAVSIIIPTMRRSFKTHVKVLVKAGEGVVYIVIVCAIAGLVMGCLGITGLGSNLSQKIVAIAGNELWLLLLLAALGSIVLGMGVPVTATYIILVILIGPALVQGGVTELAAHMFVFYFGTLSFLTPPVCISVFVAAALARAPPMRTAFFSMRLALIAYLIPFLFVYHPGFLLQGSPEAIANTLVGAVAGVYLLTIGLVGYCVRPLGLFYRLSSIAVGLAMLWIGVSSWSVAVLGWLLIGGAQIVRRIRSEQAASCV
ncbi:MAG: TRAP transporter fused permease subunit [Pseudomonadota bacterium]|nr:MAG: TRAP transporter fused permease subunit [Pseudomonadota bacterium]